MYSRRYGTDLRKFITTQSILVQGFGGNPSNLGFSLLTTIFRLSQ